MNPGSATSRLCHHERDTSFFVRHLSQEGTGTLKVPLKESDYMR